MEHLSLVNWSAMSSITAEFYQKNSTLLKHLFHQAPTGHIAHRNDPILSPACPLCDCPEERNTHVLLCTSPLTGEWRDNVISHLHIFLEKDTLRTDPVLHDILVTGLQSWFKNEEFPIARFPGLYHSLIQHQQELSWEQCFKARWSSLWESHQTRYLHHSNITEPKLSGRIWTILTGRFLLHQWFQIWDSRNKVRHGEDSNTQALLQKEIASLRLQELYKYKDQVHPRHRYLFYKTVEQHVQDKSTSDILTWIDLWSATTQHSSYADHTVQTTLDSFLHPL